METKTIKRMCPLRMMDRSSAGDSACVGSACMWYLSSGKCAVNKIASMPRPAQRFDGYCQVGDCAAVETSPVDFEIWDAGCRTD